MLHEVSQAIHLWEDQLGHNIYKAEEGFWNIELDIWVSQKFIYGLPICAKHSEKHDMYIEGTPASHMLRIVYNPIGEEIKWKVEWRTVDILTDKPFRKYKLKY